MRVAVVAVITLVTAASLTAADLGTYQQWIDSPEAYFATKAEREQWNAIGTEAEAARFVEQFRSKRGPAFLTELKDRVANADRYLTIGKVPGSQTLRGRVIVLFGPPAAMTASDHTVVTRKRDNPIMSGALSNAGSGAGSAKNSDNVNAPAELSTANVVRTYAMTYTGKAAEQVDRKSVTFTIDADLTTGKDRFASRAAASEAEDLFELAARASIVR